MNTKIIYVIDDIETNEQECQTQILQQNYSLIPYLILLLTIIDLLPQFTTDNAS